jgi:hypothetical protein
MLNVADVWSNFSTRENNSIYINESLTPTNRKLHAEVRKFKQENNYKYVWVKGGNIYLRKADGNQRHHIRSIKDLAGLQKKK